MNILGFNAGRLKLTLEKIGDSTREPIFKIIGLSVIVCLTVLYFISPLGFIAENRNDTSGIQEILSSIIGVMTSIIVTTYSIKLLLLQLTSQQFSPRVIRILLKSSARSLFFGLFIGAIICSYIAKISLLSLVMNPELLLFSKLFVVFDLILIAIGLPFFIHNITDSINAASISNLIFHYTFDTIKDMYGTEDWKASNGVYALPQVDKNNMYIVQLRSRNTGYLQNVDYAALQKLKNCAYLAKIVDSQGFEVQSFYQNKMIGNFVQIEGNLLDIVVLPKTEGDIEKRLRNVQEAVDKCAKTAKNINKIFHIGKYRIIEKDVNLGFRQLVDIALKAISPAVNDPATAINAIDYIGTLVHLLNKIPFPSIKAREWSDNYNIHIKEPVFDDTVEFAYMPIYHYGKTDPSIVIRLLQTLGTALKGSENIYNIESLVKIGYNIHEDRRTQARDLTPFDKEKIEDALSLFIHKAKYKLKDVADLSNENHSVVQKIMLKYPIYIVNI